MRSDLHPGAAPATNARRQTTKTDRDLINIHQSWHVHSFGRYHPGVPKSKGRKKKSKERAYVPRKERPKPKASPRWYPFFFLGLMGLGVLVIVLNYMGLMFGTHGRAGPYWLWIGLGIIALGFMASTKYR